MSTTVRPDRPRREFGGGASSAGTAVLAAPADPAPPAGGDLVREPARGTAGRPASPVRRRPSRQGHDPVAAARAHRRRGRRRLVVLVATVSCVVSALCLVLFSPVLGARSVEVSGAVLLTADTVRAAAAVSPGAPLVRLDTAAVADRIRALAPVAEVEVARSWPSTVVVRITERVPVAFTNTSEGKRLIDRSGLAFATVAVPPPGVPELVAASGEATVAAAAVLDTLGQPGREALRSEVVSVRADTAFDIRFVLSRDRTVRWGGADESDRKAAVLVVLLSQRGQVYDVASPDLPTIK